VSVTPSIIALVHASIPEGRADVLLRHVAPPVLDPRRLANDSATRAEIAFALGLVLYDDLLARVPTARHYFADVVGRDGSVRLDHGALRTVLGRRTGRLPAGERAFRRVLEPLGYEVAGIYPLDRLGMTGRAYAHVDAAETIPQFFVSELHPERFSSEFRSAVDRVLASARDPLDTVALASLAELELERVLPLDRAKALVPMLFHCFARQHDEPTLEDYELLLAESPEMAWIATEGNAFNHATDRVDDLERLAEEERAKGRPLKATIEVGSNGRVRQTAYKADSVKRKFQANGEAVEREVPGSFFEFIERRAVTDAHGKLRLDLSFDVGNATGIFAMTSSRATPTLEARAALLACGVTSFEGSLASRTPIDGSELGRVTPTSIDELDVMLDRSEAAFRQFRTIPAPRRGAVVQAFARNVRERASDLAALVSLEVGKVTSEARGEVQEIIDICDFAVGLSRQLHGLTIASERPDHRLLETWHPLGPIAVITAFNFPVAVFAWNATLALVCGNSVIWKPSEKTPLCAVALHGLMLRAIAETRLGFEGASDLVALALGDAALGKRLVGDERIRLVSATGSTRMGRDVALTCAPAFTRTLLELGGNNAAIVTPSADLDLAVRAITFAAAGTAGQRCTSLRRLIVHESIAESLLERLRAAYSSLSIGDPRTDGTLVGPLLDERAFTAMQESLAEAKELDGVVFGGMRTLESVSPTAFYVSPAIVRMPAQHGPMLRETFAPILYAVTYRELDEAIALHNASSHGLSSSIFTTDLREAEVFLSARGSDCGIANVNIGTSGAEIGGAFGGEKDTGGGRESGSDAWKSYMRRATNTIHYGRDLPLAQGVKFDLPRKA